MQKPEIFISYAWGGESEKIVDILYNAFFERGYNVVRDKVNLGFKGSITSFMDKIGQGKYVIVVISDKYIKSENCMYEIVQIAKNGQFHDRIFPIVLSDANFYSPVNRIKYIAYWEQKKKELNESMKSLEDMSIIAEIQKELANYNAIHQSMSNILFVLKDMNTLTPDMHRDSDFEELFRAIDAKIALDNELNKNFKAADEELKNRILDNQNKEYAYDIFLSFSNKNKPEVEKTAAVLRQYGLRVFVSNDSLAESIGDSFGDRINYALENSQHFLLLCTPEAMASKWVKAEHESFFNHCFNSSENRLFFILKGTNFKDTLLPLTYRSLQYAEQATDIVKVLGIKVTPQKDETKTKQRTAEEQAQDLAKRQESYRRFFKLLYKDTIIDQDERHELELKQEQLQLTADQVATIENEVKEAVAKEAEETLRKVEEENRKALALAEAEKKRKEEEAVVLALADTKRKEEEAEQLRKQQAEEEHRKATVLAN